MSSWGNYDNAANVPLWAASTVNLKPDTANATNLFSNTTADVFVTGATVGVFGVDANEAAVDGHISTGWVKRTTFSGGRAGRVQEEVLVALSTMNGDYEDTVYKDTVISITTQPSNGSAVHGTGNTISFNVVATGTPSATLNYYWQYNNGAVWANTATGGTLFTGNTSTTLVANAATTTMNGYKVRVIVNADGTGAAAATSANANIAIS